MFTNVHSLMITHSNAQTCIQTWSHTQMHKQPYTYAFYTRGCAMHIHTQALTRTRSQTQTFYFGSNQPCKTKITPGVFPVTPPTLLLKVTLSEAWNRVSMWTQAGPALFPMASTSQLRWSRVLTPEGSLPELSPSQYSSFTDLTAVNWISNLP